LSFTAESRILRLRDLYGLGCAVFAPVEVAAGKGFGPLDDVLSTVYRV